MKRIYLFLFLIVCPLSNTFSQHLKAYQIYTGKGKKVSFSKFIKKAVASEVILFGEIHNDPILHWLQYETLQALISEKIVTLGLEMMESDNQNILNRYLSKEIDKKAFSQKARLWGNYETDYSPMVELVKSRGFKVIATNVPRRYARQVAQQGLESLGALPDAEKVWIAPLPIEYDPNLPGYKNMLSMMGDHANENFPKAQAVKDATMAYFIENNTSPNEIFLHLNGSYHSDNYEGILWYLKKRSPNKSYLTISAAIQEDINRLDPDYYNKADFIICVDSHMTKTH